MNDGGYILCVIIAVQLIIHRLERNDLCDRLMSRSLSEYKDKRITSPYSVHRRIVDKWRGKDGEN